MVPRIRAHKYTPRFSIPRVNGGAFRGDVRLNAERPPTHAHELLFCYHKARVDRLQTKGVRALPARHYLAEESFWSRLPARLQKSASKDTNVSNGIVSMSKPSPSSSDADQHQANHAHPIQDIKSGRQQQPIIFHDPCNQRTQPRHKYHRRLQAVRQAVFFKCERVLYRSRQLSMQKHGGHHSRAFMPSP